MTMPDDERSPEQHAALQRLLAVSEPMPDAVWARLQLALAQEADSTQRRRRRSPWLPGLAAAAAVVVVGALLWPTLGGERAEPVAAPEAVTMQAAPASAAAAADQSMTRIAPAASVPVLESGTDYDADAIDASVIRLASNVVPDDTPTAGEDGFTATPEGLNDCLGAVLIRAQTPDPRPLVVDRATLDGAEVGVLVLAPSGQRYEVFVVDLGCSAQDPGIRLHRWVPAP